MNAKNGGREISGRVWGWLAHYLRLVKMFIPAVRVKMSRYWVPLVHEDTKSDFVLPNPQREKIRILFHLDPEFHPRLQASTCKGSWANWKSRFYIECYEDIRVAIQLTINAHGMELA